MSGQAIVSINLLMVFVKLQDPRIQHVLIVAVAEVKHGGAQIFVKFVLNLGKVGY